MIYIVLCPHNIFRPPDYNKFDQTFFVKSLPLVLTLSEKKPFVLAPSDIYRSKYLVKASPADLVKPDT